MKPAAIHVDALKVGYGAADVLKGVSLTVAEGECVAILGANGAGKTTLLRALSGVIRPTSGRIAFGDRFPRRHEPAAIATLGVAHVPEGRGTLGGLTVEENLLAGGYLRRRGEVKAEIERCFAYFPILRTYRRRQATSLSGGEQQMLAVSRALMMAPQVLLLDEPSFGLAPKVVATVYATVARILTDRALSVLLVEQSIELAERLAGRAYLLKNGRIVAEGAVRSLRDSEAVKEAYISRAVAYG
ncbi:MAG: ABC transporter ATP-binding protein [Rhodospirillaceae bacterium]|nr:ABC transporter ATP-binding protein [Rhodospirillaceae bacterium]